MSSIKSYKHIMEELGIEFDEDNIETPARVMGMLWEMTESLREPIEYLNDEMSVFDAKNAGIVEVKDIPFTSLCSHHHMPFFGFARVAYQPKDKVIGLSKIPRVVEWFSKKPQLQEYLTQEIGEYLVGIIKPVCLRVELYDCVHTCMLCRGAKSPGKTATYYEYDICGKPLLEALEELYKLEK
jgi:GTP cyclohydrolase I